MKATLSPSSGFTKLATSGKGRRVICLMLMGLDFLIGWLSMSYWNINSNYEVGRLGFHPMFSLSSTDRVRGFEEDDKRDESIWYMVGPISTILSYESRKPILFFHHKNTQLTLYKSGKKMKWLISPNKKLPWTCSILLDQSMISSFKQAFIDCIS